MTPGRICRGKIIKAKLIITIVCSKAVDFKTGFDFSRTFQEISFAQKKDT
jgi:hypothetical protein